MGRLSESLLERTQEMVRRDPGDLRDVSQVDRLIEARLDEIAPAMQTLIQLYPCGRSHGRQPRDLHSHVSMHRQHSLHQQVKLFLHPSAGCPLFSEGFTDMVKHGRE